MKPQRREERGENRKEKKKFTRDVTEKGETNRKRKILPK
jgi:hypothetical protein